jgi:hypothetical protein
LRKSFIVYSADTFILSEVGMFPRILGLCLALFLAPGARAETEFGTREEAMRLAELMISIIDAEGIEAAMTAMHSPDLPFLRTRMGVNLFQNHFVVADNREPEMVAADFARTADLTGVPVWPRISDAASRGEDVVLKWYHYDTQAHYDYHCYALAAGRDAATVMVCR